MSQNLSPAYADTKPHYNLLDGLRGVAALIVIGYHSLECYPVAEQVFAHGYLAVDFFFILSGFVMGYAYDDRWQKGKMTTGEFFKRRLIRLHPMVIIGAVLGAITFCVQGSETWGGEPVAFSMVMLAMLCGMLMIPANAGWGYEVRGAGELYPLNGPAWSLFFEYIGNVLYALVLRRFSKPLLKVVVGASAIGLVWYTCTLGNNMVGSGWACGEHGYGFLGGFLRLSFAFSIGLLLSRGFNPMKVRGAFWICSVVLIVLLAMPHMGEWWNGLYEVACVIFVFPLLVYLGASGQTTDRSSTRVCKFLGDISYPLYIVHYPFMYLYFAWVWNNNIPIAQAIPVIAVLIPGCILLAYLCLKFYDEPVRRWLSRKWLKKGR